MNFGCKKREHGWQFNFEIVLEVLNLDKGS